MSILKVNTIQDKGGNAIISSDGAGTITPSFGVGKIGQVVQSVVSTQLIINTSTFTNIGFDLNITPTSTSSKILATFFAPVLKTNNYNTRTETRLFYTVGGVETDTQSFGFSLWTETADDSAQTVGGSYLHSPASVSQLTYTVKFNNVENTNGQIVMCWGNKPATLTLMEVLA
jgi:hypothetical protein